ncbi:uncharacterized protein DUF1775 [Krasilnikovia cinnamomea]|uniref:Uncharacterized protein DUF1775 n=1 Tax=Krasilnikovia cinnamomea TaxID=349313 RepID=A0A4V2G6F6_9ACTN|nr:uncharacterized protein DUF1775 [Krasilnikovia cinnamomea]
MAAATAGVLCAAGPAAADVTVSPASVPQGSGQNLTFHVTNPGSKQISTVRLVLPPDTPVAEVYPLSVDDWAPRIDPRHLDTPLESIHGGTPVTETASAISWIAVGGKSLAPGKSADLAVALGPLPTLSSMRFTVQATYADGTPAPAMAADLTLTPAAPGQAPAGHTGHGGTAANPTQADDAAFAKVVSQADQGPGFWTIAGWVVAVLAGAGAVWALRRSRRRDGGAGRDGAARGTRDADATAGTPEGAAADSAAKDGKTKDGTTKDGAANGADSANEPVGAGASRARITGWSYRDGP